MAGKVIRQQPGFDKRMAWLDTEMVSESEGFGCSPSGDIAAIERAIQQQQHHLRQTLGLMREMHAHYVSRQPQLGEAAERAPALRTLPRVVELDEGEAAFVRWALYSCQQAQDSGPPVDLDADRLASILVRLGRPAGGDEFENDETRGS